MTDTRTAREVGDPGELERARRGDRRSFLNLYEQHAPRSWRLALVAGRDTVAAEAAVVGAFAHVLGQSDRRDLLRFAAVEPQLLRSVREIAVEQTGRIEAPAGLAASSTTKHTDTLRAFDLLPERWRTVLWLDQIEHIDLSTTAAVLGATEQTTAGLTTRALAGLREQLAHLLVSPDLHADCRQTTVRLGGYVAHALPSRDTIRSRRHLDRCEACRTRLDLLDDVTPHLRRVLPPLPDRIESFALGAWLARTHEGAGPIGLRLPGGTLAPAWVERSLAGATAAVVTLGISAAVLLSGRDGTNPVPTESAAAPPDGEQAFGDQGATDDDAVSDGGVTVSDPLISSSDDPTSSGGVSTGGSNGSTGGAGPSSAPGAAPRGGSAPTSPDPGPSPTPTPRPAPTPSNPSDPSSPPPSSNPVDEVLVDVDGVVDDVCGALAPVCDSLPVAAPLPQIPGL